MRTLVRVADKFFVLEKLAVINDADPNHPSALVAHFDGEGGAPPFKLVFQGVERELLVQALNDVAGYVDHSKKR